MGDFVVAGKGGVDGGPAFHHVSEHAVDDHVAHDNAHRRAYERVLAAAVAPWTHIASLGLRCGRPLEDHFPAEEHEGAHHVEAVREKGTVARICALLRVD